MTFHFLNTDANREERRKCGLLCSRRTERCSVFHPDPGLSGGPGPGWGKLFLTSVSQLSQHIARDWAVDSVTIAFISAKDRTVRGSRFEFHSFYDL
jgi:hypothetical protein